MTPLIIELKPAFPWRTTWTWLAIGGLALGSGALGWAVWSTRSEVEALKESSTSLEKTVAGLKARRQAALVRPPYLDALGELVSISRFPLDEAVSILERVDVPGSRVVDLDIDIAERRALALVESSSAPSLQLFLEGLSAESGDGGWQLQAATAGMMVPEGVSWQSTSTSRAPSPFGMGGTGARQVVVTPNERGAEFGPVRFWATVSWK